MSEKYKMYENESAYFLTMTVVDWIDVFTKKRYKLKLIDSLKWCQLNKGLEIFGWCLMPNHLHLIARAGSIIPLYEIIRDFKKFTAHAILKEIIENQESRKDWILTLLKNRANQLKRIEKYKFWQDGNHAEIIYSPSYFYEKLNYIHQNPVVQMIVQEPEDYLFSSARNYAGLESLLDVIIETPQLRTK